MKFLLIALCCFAGWSASAQYNRPPHGTIDAKTRELELPTPVPVEERVELESIEEKAEKPAPSTPAPPTAPPPSSTTNKKEEKS